MRNRLTGLVVVCSLLLAAAANASRDGELGLDAAPGSGESAEGAWAAAVELEQSVFSEERPPEFVIDRLSRAALLFERVGDLEAGLGQGYWRAARATWIAGETLPLEDEAGRLRAFERSLALADTGLAANPDCAECMLWKFISMGRLRTTKGVWEGIKQVPEMAELLDRAIALQPTHRDGEDNSTLGNLHYSSAIFYRLVPDWFWLRWVLGVRGDKERALEHSRVAYALHPGRIDYQIEVATQLLCLGTVKDDPARLAEGRTVMRDAISRDATTADERREVQFARRMLADPAISCGYSGDKILEMDEKKARGASK